MRGVGCEAYELGAALVVAVAVVVVEVSKMMLSHDVKGSEARYSTTSYIVGVVVCL